MDAQRAATKAMRSLDDIGLKDTAFRVDFKDRKNPIAEICFNDASGKIASRLRGYIEKKAVNYRDVYIDLRVEIPPFRYKLSVKPFPHLRLEPEITEAVARAFFNLASDITNFGMSDS